MKKKSLLLEVEININKYSPTVGIIRGLDTWIGPRGGVFHLLSFQIPTSSPISPVQQ